MMKGGIMFIALTVVAIVAVLGGSFFYYYGFIKAAEHKGAVALLKLQGAGVAEPYVSVAGIGWFSNFDCNEKYCFGVHFGFGQTSCINSCMSKINGTSHDVIWGGNIDKAVENDLTVTSYPEVICNRYRCYLVGNGPNLWIARFTEKNDIAFNQQTSEWRDSIKYLDQVDGVDIYNIGNGECDSFNCYFIVSADGGRRVLKIELGADDFGDTTLSPETICAESSAEPDSSTSLISIDCSSSSSCYVMCDTHLNALYQPRYGKSYEINKTDLGKTYLNDIKAIGAYNGESLTHIGFDYFHPQMKCTQEFCYTFYSMQAYSWSDLEQLANLFPDLSPYIEDDFLQITLFKRFEKKYPQDDKIKTTALEERDLAVKFLAYSQWFECENEVDPKTGESIYGEYCYVPGIYDPGFTDTFSTKDFGIATIFGGSGQLNHITYYPALGDVETNQLGGFMCTSKFCYIAVKNELVKIKKSTL